MPACRVNADGICFEQVAVDCCLVSPSSLCSILRMASFDPLVDVVASAVVRNVGRVVAN